MGAILGEQGEPQLTDHELCEAIRSGEAWPLATLWQRYHGIALSWARRKDPVHAEDAVADAFDAVYQSLVKGKGPTDSFSGYLFKTITTQLSRYWETGKREGLTHDEESDDPLALSGDEQLSEEEQRKAAMAALEDLPLRWKRVILEVDVAGRPVQEVATELDLSPNSTSVLLRRAREGLKKSWLKQMHPPRGLAPDCEACVSDFTELRWGRAKSKRRERAEMHLHSCARCSTRWKSFAEQATIIGMVSAGVIALDKTSRRKAAVASLAAAAVTITGVVAIVAGASGGFSGNTVTHGPELVKVIGNDVLTRKDDPLAGETRREQVGSRGPETSGEEESGRAQTGHEPTREGQPTEREREGDDTETPGHSDRVVGSSGYTEFSNEAHVNVNDLDLDGDGTPGATTNEVRSRWGWASFLKVDAADTTRGLEGATFRVLMSEKTSGCRLDRDLEVVHSTDGGEYTVSSDKNGLIAIPGLWVGDDEVNGGERMNGLSQRCYVLEEIEAPDGYRLPEGDRARTEMIIGLASAGDAPAPTKITNEAVPPFLSFTGAAGAWVAVAGGLLLVAAGGIIVTVRQRKAS